MKRLLWFVGAVALAASLGTRPAAAQVILGPYVPPTSYNPYQQPIFSPYLNLGLPGNRGINYYGLVRPQIQQNLAVQQLQTQVLLTERQLGATQATTANLLVTGHNFGFQNQYGYFQNWRAGGIGLGGGLGGTTGLSGVPTGGLYGGLNTGPYAGGIGLGVVRSGATTTPSGLSLTTPQTTPSPTPPKK
jgi:hypothetical protein